MKKILSIVLCCIFTISCMTFVSTANISSDKVVEPNVDMYDTQNILITINSNNRSKYDSTALIKNVLEKEDFAIKSDSLIANVETIFDSSSRNTKSTENAAIIKIELTSDGSQQIDKLIDALKKDKNIISAERDYIFEIAASANSSLVITNDTRADEQYGITTTHANMAWAFTTGNSSVLVGVIDTGINRLHPDLNGNVNTELSKSFIPGITAFTDGNGHGTHVAGTIGAKTNNGKGVAGISWNVSLVSLKCFNVIGQSQNSRIISAIEYADANGIKILNCSFGNTNSISSSENQALYTAISNYSGIIVAAAGNNGTTTLNYPAAFNLNNRISVAAVDSTNTLASYSNYGTTVDLAAPGSNILSTRNTGTYETMSGTSMATPHVTGAVALLYAINPNYSVNNVRNLILNNTQDVASLSDKVVTGGMLNIFSTVCAANGRLVGDIDNNGVISAADARLALRFSEGLETFTAIEKVVADVNMDGVVTSGDAQSINRMAVGLDG